MTLSSASLSATNTASLNLTLSNVSAAGPTALQWTLQYPSGSISSITAAAGAAATNAGKSLSCKPGSGAYTCVLSGANANALAAGVVGVVNLTAASASGSIAFGLTQTLGATAAGSSLSVAATGGTVSPATGGLPAPTTATLKGISCPSTLMSGSSGNCTVTLSASTGANVAISLTSSASGLSVPSSVTVAAGSQSAQFPVTATGSIVQNAVVTASLNGASVVATVSVSASSVSVLRINAGGASYTDPAGQIWAADTSFTGGAASSTPSTPRQTNLPALYQTSRTGNAFTYALAVPNGLYTVVLKFSEPTAAAPRQRVFNVDINDHPALAYFDIFAEAGGANAAVDRSFPVSVSRGQISLHFAAGPAGAPIVNAIEVLSGSTNASTSPSAAIRVNAGGGASTDTSGLAWKADTGFTGGTATSTTGTIVNAATPEIYQTARVGASTYTFTAPAGAYAVILKFAETSYTAAGKRQFNVAVNGARVLTNFDIFAAAGGEGRAVDYALPVSVSNGTVTIALTAGAAGEPLLSGIEVIPALP